MAKRKSVLFFDPGKGELYFNGISSLIDMRVDSTRFQHGVEKILGNATKGLIYSASKDSSVMYYTLLYRRMLSGNENLSRKEFVVHCIEELKRGGYGAGQLAKYDKENLVFGVEVDNCFNTHGYKGAKKPVCHIMSGKLAALFETAFGKEMVCEEIECGAIKGGKCVFRISSSGEKSGMSEMFKEDKRFLSAKKARLKRVELEYDERGRLFFQGNPSILGFRNYWSIYQQRFEKIIGPATKTIVYDISKQGTIDAMDRIMRYIVKFVRVVSFRRLVEKVIEQIPMRGYGNIKDYSFDRKKKTGKIRIKNCFNSVGYYGKARKPVCYSMAGNIAGATEILFGREMKCTETKCEGKGDKYCEFVVKPA